MEQIREYPFEFAKPLLLCFDLLNRCNIGFFDENVPFAVKYWRFSYMIPIVVIHYITTTVYMITVFTGPVNASELTYMVPVYLLLLQCLLKALIIIPKRSDISQIVRRLGTMWRLQNLNEDQTTKKNNLLKRLNFNHGGTPQYQTHLTLYRDALSVRRDIGSLCVFYRLYNVYYWGSILTTYQHLLTPLVRTLFLRLILNQDSPLQLPFVCVYPFDPAQNWFIYLVTYTIQAYSMLCVAYFYIGTEFVMITLSAYITTEFSLLREDLVQVVPLGEAKNESMGIEQEQLSGPITIQQFICRHQKLIHLTKQLDSIFNRMIFIDLFFASVITCFFGFGATVAPRAMDKVNNYLAVLVMLFPIYVFCYYGDLLKEESAGIAASAYENLWYRGNTRYQKMISFIIMRSQRPCCLTSMEYTPITLNTFTKVVSSTWSYFSLAVSVYSKGNRN